MNKTKLELAQEMAYKNKVMKAKEIAKSILKKVNKDISIEDAQVVMWGLAGFLEVELNNQTRNIKVGDLELNLSKDKKVKKLNDKTLEVYEEIKGYSGQHSIEILKKVGDVLGEVVKKKHIKEDMSTIKESDIIAK